MGKQQLQIPQRFNTPMNFYHYVARPLYVRLVVIQDATGYTVAVQGDSVSMRSGEGYL